MTRRKPLRRGRMAARPPKCCSPSRSGAMFPKCATAEDLVKAIRDEKVQMIDLRFTDLPGVSAALLRPAGCSGYRCSQRRHWIRRLIHPRLPGNSGKRHAGRAGPDHGLPRPGCPRIDPGPDLQHRAPVTGQPYSRDPRYIAQKAKTYLKGPAARHRASSARRRSSSCSTTCATDRAVRFRLPTAC